MNIRQGITLVLVCSRRNHIVIYPNVYNARTQHYTFIQDLRYYNYRLENSPLSFHQETPGNQPAR